MRAEQYTMSEIECLAHGTAGLPQKIREAHAIRTLTWIEETGTEEQYDAFIATFDRFTSDDWHYCLVTSDPTTPIGWSSV
jgi:hypothetical protein